MPLSKKRNRDRMRQSRLHKQLSSPVQSNDVQPKPIFHRDAIVFGGYGDKQELPPGSYIDADGNVVYE